MAHCSACFKDNIISKLRTIGDQIVCSLACVGLLNSNEKDSCDYCHRPVWRDSYYKVNNKFFCNKICKDKIISELKIPSDSKSIQYFHENILFNDENNTDSDFNNSKQLREEVLKFYKDFKFDTVIHNDNIIMKKESGSSKKSNKNENEYLSDSSKGNNHRYFKRIRRCDTQEVKNTNNKNIANVEGSVDNSKSKNYVGTAKNTLDYRNSLKKTVVFKDFQNKEDNVNRMKNRTKRTKVDRLNKNIYNTYIDNYYGKEKEVNNDNKSLQNELLTNNINRNDIKSYSFINNINYPIGNNNTRNLSSNSNSHFNNIKANASDSSAKGLVYINKNKTNSVRKDPIASYCCFCGNELGRSSFLDRKGNHFCSDYCKEEFLKYGY